MFFETFDFLNLKFQAIKGESGHQPAWRESGLRPYDSPNLCLGIYRPKTVTLSDILVTRLSLAHTHTLCNSYYFVLFRIFQAMDLIGAFELTRTCLGSQQKSSYLPFVYHEYLLLFIFLHFDVYMIENESF